MSKRPIKTPEFNMLLEYMKNDKETRKSTLHKYKMIFVFLYYTGCRINEVCKLKGQDIINIIENKTTKLLTTKTKRFKGQEFRTVSFSDNAVKDITREFIEYAKFPEGYCIRSCNNPNKQINIVSLTNRINDYLKKALNTNDVGTHSFRRGILTEMIIDKKITPEIAQLFIGHKNYSTTSSYVKPTQFDVQKNLIR